MAQTKLTATNLGAKAVDRNDMDTATTGIAVITKVIAGTGHTISSTGIDAGTGDVTINKTDLAYDRLTIVTNQTIPAGWASVLPRKITINSGIKLGINSGAILRIL